MGNLGIYTIEKLWAKLNKENDKVAIYHPLLLHMLDVAACVQAILLREPQHTCKRMAECIDLPWEESSPWLLLLIACHDIGKACPGFQCKDTKRKEQLRKTGFNIPKLPDTTIKHNFVSQIALEGLLREVGWQAELAEYCADAVGCHHGIRATPKDLDYFSGNRNGVDKRNWEPCWKEIFNIVKEIVGAKKVPDKCNLSGSDFMLISGLASFADWIGSNEDYFPFGSAANCSEPAKWFKQSCEKAEQALDAIGWGKRTPLSEKYRSFADVFPQCMPPRPLQQAVAEAVSKVSSASVILIEAPMGEGKTEAAFYAHLELQRRFGHRGMYMALPTKATGNAMFKRTLSFLHSFSDKRNIDLQLVHGAAYLNDTFQKVRLTQICAEGGNGSVSAGEWFTSKKRALLSEYGVGTIDQALLTILPVRHYFVRLWGLANRVVIFDEIHAYDAYTNTLLFHLIRWLRALGSSIILLSATLPPEFRRRLSDTLGTKIPEHEAVYPRLTIFDNNGCRQVPFSSEIGRQQTVFVEQLSSSLEEIKSCVMHKLTDSGYAGIIVNTVQRAQDLYVLFGSGEIIESDGIIIGKRLSDGIEIHLFHARYPAQERQKREDAVLSIYGKNEDENGKLKERFGKRVLIATQVVEQSLDLDFDLLITDLAPVDLVLQRAGRLWRHRREKRPIDQPLLLIAGLTGKCAGSFGEPLWWNKVYREDILIRTWEILKNNDKIILPDHIESLVIEVYNGIAMPTDEETISRLEKAEINSDGETLAQQSMAHQSVIGLPDDGSWKDASRFYLYDDDEPGVHHTLIAKTRLGEDSIIVIPIFPEDNFGDGINQDNLTVKKLFLRGISVSRKNVVKQLRGTGVPAEWEKSSLLRNCYPFILDEDNRWVEGSNIRFDKELGLVYEKET